MDSGYALHSSQQQGGYASHAGGAIAAAEDPRAFSGPHSPRGSRNEKQRGAPYHQTASSPVLPPPNDHRGRIGGPGIGAHPSGGPPPHENGHRHGKERERDKDKRRVRDRERQERYAAKMAERNRNSTSGPQHGHGQHPVANAKAQHGHPNQSVQHGAHSNPPRGAMHDSNFAPISNDPKPHPTSSRARFPSIIDFRWGHTHYPGVQGLNSKDYVPYYRPYPIATFETDICELSHRFSDVQAPGDLCRILKHWVRTVPCNSSIIDSPPIDLNSTIPLLFDNSLVSAASASFNPHLIGHPSPNPYTMTNLQKSKMGAGATSKSGSKAVVIEVRVLIPIGSPIDISAPKTGNLHHSNEKMTFLLLETIAEDGGPHFVVPGGFFDPLLDSESGVPESNVSDSELITASIRLMRDQLSLDLTPCKTWYRFLELEYGMSPAHVHKRVIYMIPKIIEAVVDGSPEFAATWRRWKSEEQKAPIRDDIVKLRHHMKQLSQTASGASNLAQLEARLAQKETELNEYTLPPEFSPPEKAMLIVRPNPESTAGCASAVTASLFAILQWKGAMPDSMIELYFVAQAFDEYLQRYFGICIFLHVAIMLSHYSQNEINLAFAGVELAAIKPSTQPAQNASNNNQIGYNDPYQDNNAATETKRVAKIEIKSEFSPAHTMQPDAPSQAEIDAQLGQGDQSSSFTTSLAPNVQTEHGEKRPGIHRAPAQMPEHRDYRIMQAFRYFDLHRLGFIRGRDLEKIFLSLGLGLSRATALALVAASDESLPRRPSIDTKYDPLAPLRYRPTCDWLSARGYAVPKL